MNKEQAVLKAVEKLKKSEYGATAIKVELEVQLERYEDCSDVRYNILRELEPLGLSKKVGQLEEYVPKNPLIYADVYDDGSVDTELTFTLSLNKPKNILLLPKIVEVFTRVAEESGDYFEIDRAGMHMALLNNSQCKYPAKVKPYDGMRFNNFRKSMIRLLPALYFLGSHNEHSRELRFRTPQIARCETDTNHRYSADSQKYSAVAFRHGAVEFRVFETCYGKPDAILDNVIVMSNAMKFWTRKYTRNYLKPMPKPVKFGIDSGFRLERLYLTTQHIDLLNEGLNILKPSYYTINELKKQRNFKVTKTAINAKLRNAKQQAIKDYVRYEQRFKWSTIFEEQDYIRCKVADYMNSYVDPDADEKQVMAKLRREAKKQAERFKQSKVTQPKFIEQELDKIIPNKGGSWELKEPEPTPRRQAGATMTSTDGTVSFNNIVTAEF